MSVDGFWSEYVEQVALNNGHSAYIIDLLFDHEPTIVATPLRDAIARRSPGPVELVDGDGPGVMLVFPETEVRFTEGSIAAQVHVLPTDKLDGEILRLSLAQTWEWDGAREAVGKASHSVQVFDMMAGPLDPQERLRLFNTVLQVVVEEHGPVAINWLPAGKVVEPAAYLEAIREDPIALSAAVNVRFFNLSDRAGEYVMDTLGMAHLRLPDIQMHYTELEPPWVAGKVFGIADYLREHGDIIEDAQTVPGLGDHERWPCAHERALLGPERAVLDVDPSPHGPRRD